MILALDCSQNDLCLALIRDGRVAHSMLKTPEEKHSLDLLRGIVGFLSTAKADLADVSQVLYCNGPGSFTSLRIGLATLQGLFVGRGEGFSFCTCSSLLLRCLSVRHGGDAIEVRIPAGRNRAYRGRLEGDNFREDLVENSASVSSSVPLRPEAFLAALSRADWHANVPLNAVPLNYLQAPNIG